MNILSILLVAAFATRVPAQDTPGLNPESSFRWTRVEPESVPIDLPRSLLAEPRPPIDDDSEFSLGPAAGYLQVRGADRGAWFGGIQGRCRFIPALAVEGSFIVHRDEHQGGDVSVVQYPVQATLLLYVIPEGPVQPYLQGGIGWYYTSIDYRGVLSFMSDRSEHIFGGHLGAGVEIRAHSQVSFDAAFRYIFLNPTTDAIIGRDFDYWQISLGLSLFF